MIHQPWRLACIQIAFLASIQPLTFAEDETPTISVSETAEILVVPDEVILTASVESRGKELAEASTDNDTKIADVIAFLRASGIPEKGIRTEVIRISPVFPSNRSKMQASDPFAPAKATQSFDQSLNPIGYVVKREFVITMKQLNRFEEVYRGLIQRGVNDVDGIVFQTSKLREYRDQARVSAIRDAKKKAEALANELGAKLAGVQTIRESQSGYRNSPSVDDVFGGPFGGEPAPLSRLAAGQIEIIATVQVVFRLKETDFE